VKIGLEMELGLGKRKLICILILSGEGGVFNILSLYTIHRDRQFKEMLDLFAMLKKGHCEGTKVRIGRLQNLLSSSCIGMGSILCIPSFGN
jgi:hypothetical protein